MKIREQLLVMVFAAVVAAAIPFAADAQEFCVEIECDCELGCRCDFDIEGWDMGSGSSNCLWAWWYYCEEYGGRCNLMTEARPALEERAESAWENARIEEIAVGGVAWVISAEVPTTLPPVDELGGWLESVRAECAERRQSVVEEAGPQGDAENFRR